MTKSAARGLPTGALGEARSADLVRRLIRERVRPHMFRLAAAVVFMCVAAAASAGNAWMMQPVLDDVFIKRDATLLYLVPIAILALAMIKGGSSYGQSVLLEYVGQRVVAGLQRDMYARLMQADLGFFADTATGQLISRFTNDAHALRRTLISALTGLVKDTLSLVFLVGLMFYQNWLMALIAFVVFPTAVLPIVKIGRRIRKVSSGTQARLADLTTCLDETFEGARVIRAYGMEAHETARADSIIESVFRLSYRGGRVRALNRPIMDTLGGLAVGGVILYGGSQVIAGLTTPGTFFSFMTALLLAYQPLKSIATLNAILQEGLASTERVFAVIDMEPGIVDAPDAVPLTVRRGEIRFEGVRFGYGHGVAAVEDLDLVVPAGMTVALVGPSGAGKSTVLNLIPRFYDAEEGAVLVDGHDVRSVTLQSLRASIALVSQEIMLFDDTVGANIAYGRPDATREEIVEAAKNAGAHDFIEAMPQGYDTGVGGRGAKLSGGQRQRIAIARAMLKDAPILLLDEATSALDSESERTVRDALARLKKGRTTLVIAHRLSTVVDSDLIYVLDHGRVVETGSHGQLIARGGAYARQYAMQFAGAEGEPVAAAGGAR